jgi:hypothetical protein
MTHCAISRVEIPQRSNLLPYRGVLLGSETPRFLPASRHPNPTRPKHERANPKA